MRSRIFLWWSSLIVAFIAIPGLRAASPADFSDTQIEAIWKELWKSGDSVSKEPQIQTLSTNYAIKHMAGEWAVMFGVTPDRLTVSLRMNQTVEVSGRKDGANWKKSGQWRVSSDKVVLYLEKDSIPSFVFRTANGYYIFDPWAKPMMSELRRVR